MYPYFEKKARRIFLSHFCESYNFPSHFHSYFEITCCLDGIQKVKIGEKIYTLKKGDVIAVFPGNVHVYAEMKKAVHVGMEKDMQFIKIPLKENDKWVGKRVGELGLPEQVIMSMIKRGERVLIPRGDVLLQEDDIVIFGAEPFGEETEDIHLTELILREDNPWVGKKIRDLDISRHSIIILVKRKGKVRIPNGNMVLQEWDRVFMYTDQYVVDGTDIEV